MQMTMKVAPFDSQCLRLLGYFLNEFSLAYYMQNGRV